MVNSIVNKAILFLRTLSGEDDYIIRLCKRPIQISFAFIGFVVLLIFAGCWISASSFMSNLFGGSGRVISMLVGIVWALLVINIYLLLLYTISPTLLPNARKKRGKGHVRKVVDDSAILERKSSLTTSLIFRVAFISILAVIIAQPLNVLMLSWTAEKTMSDFKNEYRVNMMIVADSSLINQELKAQVDFYQKVKTKILPKDSVIADKIISDKVIGDQIFLLNSRSMLDSLKKWKTIGDYKYVKKSDSLRIELMRLLENEINSDYSFLADIDNVNFNNSVLQAEFDSYRSELKKTITAKIKNYNTLDFLLQKSNFYITTIKVLLSENAFAWMLTGFVCCVFLVPIYWKFRIRNDGGFYEKKKYIENRLVNDNYSEFKKAYEAIFDQKIRLYSRRSWVNLLKILHQLEKINPEKYNGYLHQIKQEIDEPPVAKYEYWADPPFRTRRKSQEKNYSSESDLLKIVYRDGE